LTKYNINYKINVAMMLYKHYPSQYEFDLIF